MLLYTANYFYTFTVVIGFGRVDYTIEESGGTVMLSVSVQHISEAENIIITLTTSDDTAQCMLVLLYSIHALSCVIVQSQVWYYCPTAPADYTSVTGVSLTFTRGRTSQSVNITIRDDTTVEDSESFVVNAAIFPSVRLAPDTANIHIMDNDGEILHNMCGSVKSCVHTTVDCLHDWNSFVLLYQKHIVWTCSCWYIEVIFSLLEYCCTAWDVDN